jgi:tetratricopeptide (TPR) repeat protein
MTDHDLAYPAQTDGFDSLNEFERLRRFVVYHLGGFALGMVRVNDPKQRKGVLASLAQALSQSGVRLVVVDLSNHHPYALGQALRDEPGVRAVLQSGEKAGLAVVGMEHLIEAEAGPEGRPPFAAALNLERDALRTSFPLPLLIFLSDHSMDRLDIAAPDFFDWYSGVFRLRPPQLVHESGAPYTANLDAREKERSYVLTSEALEQRLELLEERQTELRGQGPGALLRLAQVLQEIGELHAERSELNDRQMAVSYLREAAAIFSKRGEKSQHASVLEKLGQVAYWINEYAVAKRSYDAALPIYQEIGSRLGEANCIKSLGNVHVQLAEYPQARARYDAALPIYQEIGDRLGEANCIKSLGNVHVQLAEYPQARARYDAALPIYQEIGDRLGEANTYTKMGDLCAKQKEWSEARRWFETASPIYRDINSPHWQTYLALQLGKVYIELNQEDLAIDTLENGAASARSISGQPNLQQLQELIKQIRRI